MTAHDEAHEDPRELFARMRRDLINTQTSRLAEAAGRPADEATRRAFAEIVAWCGPDTIDTLVALLRQLCAVAPHRIGAFPVVAFAGYGNAPGTRPNRGVAITAESDRFNVHTVFFDESTARWEGQNGHYGLSWQAARAELNSRADLEAQP
jgi:hypothetical protein